MFSTDIHHWLQSFYNLPLYYFLRIVSLLGLPYFMIPIVLAIAAGINFRLGYIILACMGWTIILTTFFKDTIDYPRPREVDPTLESFGEKKSAKDFRAQQPQTIFELFSDDVLDYTRSNSLGTPGFPSGHTSIQTAVWLGLAFLVGGHRRKRRIWAIAIGAILFTMISRMFLAQHYLGDVIGGFLLGAFMTSIIYIIVKRLKIPEPHSASKSQVAFFMAPLVFICFFPYINSFQAGSFIGINLALVFSIFRWGFPQTVLGLRKRSVNAFIFIVVYFAFYMIGRPLKIENETLLALIFYIILSFLAIVTAMIIAKRCHVMTFEHKVRDAKHKHLPGDKETPA